MNNNIIKFYIQQGALGMETLEIIRQIDRLPIIQKILIVE
jgi:hypothetical protein